MKQIRKVFLCASLLILCFFGCEKENPEEVLVPPDISIVAEGVGVDLLPINRTDLK